MPSTPIDILGIGNAIVDILSHGDEATLAGHQLAKGSMTLIDEARAERIYGSMGPATECSGGSAANTLAGAAGLGAVCAFIGKVRDDQLGAIFRHDMQAVGIQFDTPAATSGPATARCMVLVTPDGERTMATYLGACSQVEEQDIDEALIAGAGILYIEGYLWDQPHAIAAIRKGIAAAKKSGARIAFTMSDLFCVERHRAEFLQLLDHTIDILFANEGELMALFQVNQFDSAVQALQGKVAIAAITRGAAGAVVVTPDAVLPVAAAPVAKVVDTTGAGDLFASGFLYGLTKHLSHQACAELGNACAGQIIQQLGARSQVPLKTLAERLAA